MNYCRVGEYLSISRITGSRDNLLQVRIAKDLPERINVVVFPAIRPYETAKLDPDKVLSAVQLGLEQVNADLGKTYFISEIRIVTDDAKPESIYSFLTDSLIRHLDSGLFDARPNNSFKPNPHQAR